MPDIEEIIPKIASDIAVSVITEIFKVAYEGWPHAKKWLKEKLGISARKYADRMEERYNSMKIFGMSEPKPIRDIYVRLNILEKISARQHISIKDLEDSFKNENKDFYREKNTKDGMEIVKEKPKLIVCISLLI